MNFFQEGGKKNNILNPNFWIVVYLIHQCGIHNSDLICFNLLFSCKFKQRAIRWWSEAKQVLSHVAKKTLSKLGTWGIHNLTMKFTHLQNHFKPTQTARVLQQQCTLSIKFCRWKNMWQHRLKWGKVKWQQDPPDLLIQSIMNVCPIFSLWHPQWRDRVLNTELSSKTQSKRLPEWPSNLFYEMFTLQTDLV